MPKFLTKTLLGGAAAAAIAVFAYSPSADAACWWNGYNWSCNAPAYSYAPPPAWGSYAYPPDGGYYDPYAGFGVTGRYPGPKTN